jgi:4-amino-4-deoxy-L-arabinose transferase-like glycosyltransferase
MSVRPTRSQPAVSASAPVRPLVRLALVAVIAIGVALRIIDLSGVPSRSPDEGTYTDYASRIADQGPAAIRALVAEYEADSGRWVYPPPTRVGYAGLIALAMKISDARDPSVGAAVSCLFSSLSLVLLAWLGWRFFNPWIALCAVTFLAVLVGELGVAERAWQDAPFGFFGLLLVYLTCEIARSPRRLPLYLAFLAVGAYSVLTKETGVVAYGLCTAWVMGVLLVKERSWKAAAMLAAGGAASLAGTVLVWSVLCGGMGPAFSVLSHAARARSSPWTVLNCSGPWYQFPYLLWIVDPATAVLALVGTVVAALPRRLLDFGLLRFSWRHKTERN